MDGRARHRRRRHRPFELLSAFIIGLVVLLGGGETARACACGLQNADLAVTLTDGKGVIAKGATATFTATITQVSGYSTSAGLSVGKDSGIVLGTWTCADYGATCPAVSGTFDSSGATVPDLGSIATGGKLVFKFTATLPLDFPGATASLDAFVGSYGKTDSNQANNLSPDVNKVTAATGIADLGVSVSDGVSSATRNSALAYVVQVTNRAGSNVTDGTLTFASPAGVAFGAWSCLAVAKAVCPKNGSGNLALSRLVIPVGSTLTFTVNANVSAQFPDNAIRAVAKVSSVKSAEWQATDNTAVDEDTVAAPAVQNGAPDLAVAVSSGSASVARMVPSTFTMTVKNGTAFSSTVTDAAVTSTPPSGVTYGAWTCSATAGATCPVASGSGPIAQTGATLAGGSSLTYGVTVTADTSFVGASVPISVTASTAASESSVANNTATETKTAQSAVLALESGWMHSCALLRTGVVKCWGANTSGQLGDGTTTGRLTATTATTLTSTGKSVKALAAGATSTCVVFSDGKASCLGTTLFQVPGITTAVAVAVGDTHACVVVSSGAVRCWGDNSDGQLGNGTLVGSQTPVQVTGITDAVAVAAGSNFTCALLKAGTVRCWGYGSNGELGNGKTGLNYNDSTMEWGTEYRSLIPVPVAGVAKATALSASWNNACALMATGLVSCWGDNGGGQLGNGSLTVPRSGKPLKVVGVTTARAVSSSGCVALANESVKCWGWNGFGGLGDGTKVDSLSPVTALGVTSRGPISTGPCAAVGEGVKCWGLNDRGQVGNGSTNGSGVSTPSLVVGL